MTVWALVLAAGAVLLVPASRTPRRLTQLRGVQSTPEGWAGADVPAAGGLRARRRWWPTPAWFSAAHRPRWVLAGGTATAVGLLGVLPVIPAVCFGAVAALLVQTGWRAVERRAVSRSADTIVSVVGALADELRAGRSPPQALRAVAAHHAGPIAAVLGEAARTDQLGGDTELVFRSGSRPELPGESGGAAGAGLSAAAGAASAVGDLTRLAAAWRLSTSSGCSLAEVLDALAADLRARRRQDRLLVGLLAGPRASAALLAGLPVVGLLMGTALGADPLRVLTSTGPGQLALAAGVGLTVAGVLWTANLVRGARG